MTAKIYPDRNAAVRGWSAQNKERVRLINRRHIVKRKEFVNWIKLGIGCVDCGYNEHPEALDLDHVRGKKKFSVSTALWRTPEVLYREIRKCQVVCANCHRIRTAKRRLNANAHPLSVSKKAA